MDWRQAKAGGLNRKLKVTLNSLCKEYDDVGGKNKISILHAFLPIVSKVTYVLLDCFMQPKVAQLLAILMLVQLHVLFHLLMPVQVQPIPAVHLVQIVQQEISVLLQVLLEWHAFPAAEHLVDPH